MDRFVLLCLIVSVTGLVLLFFSAQVLEPTAISINSINADTVGAEVHVTGTVESFFENNGHMFLTVSDSTGSMKVVIFSDLASKLLEKTRSGIRKDASVAVSGIVDEYKNELEIVPRKPSDIIVM